MKFRPFFCCCAASLLLAAPVVSLAAMGNDSTYATGYKNGETYGYKTGYNEGYAAGKKAAGSSTSDRYQSGYNAGHDAGYDEGYSLGLSEGKSYASKSNADQSTFGWVDGLIFVAGAALCTFLELDQYKEMSETQLEKDCDSAYREAYSDAYCKLANDGKGEYYHA